MLFLNHLLCLPGLHKRLLTQSCPRLCPCPFPHLNLRRFNLSSRSHNPKVTSRSQTCSLNLSPICTVTLAQGTCSPPLPCCTTIRILIRRTTPLRHCPMHTQCTTTCPPIQVICHQRGAFGNYCIKFSTQTYSISFFVIFDLADLSNSFDAKQSITLLCP